MPTKKAPKKKTTRQKLVAKCDRLAKLHARYKNAFLVAGVVMTKCITCPKIAPIDQRMHGGHFIKSTVMPVRWMRTNIHSQCVTCNTYLDGNESMYAQFIVKEYGVEELNYLCDTKADWKAGRLKVQTIPELEFIVEEYTRLIAELEFQPPKKSALAKA